MGGLSPLPTPFLRARWYIDLVKYFCKVKDERSVDYTNKVIFRGTFIVIPEELQSKIIKLSEEGRPGILRIKALLREHVWFPSIEKQVEDEISDCMPCQATTQGNPPEPLQSIERCQSDLCRHYI